MAGEIASPYHLSPQSAPVLLRPIEATLAALEARLLQYIERVPMPDADRETVARAREVIAQNREKIAELAATPARDATRP